MNTNKVLASVILILPLTVLMIYAIQFLLNQVIQSNAMLLKLVPFIQKWEGGLSRDPNDTASSQPAPWTYQGKTGWHTNKGITYATFKGNASRLGYAPTAENFFQMPDDLWLKILRGGYMSAFPLDQINHLPRIQAVIITWAWGSGVGGAESRLAKFQREVMGVNDSNITKAEIVANFKKKINPMNEREWFNKLCDRRAEDYSKIPTCSTHCRGWNNRLREFRQLFN